MEYQDDIDKIFDSLTDLTLQQRDVIKHRYKFLMKEYRYRATLHSLIFYILRLTITVGSLAVPALLSIQTMSGNQQSMYWLTWSLSLSVTTANGVMTLFKLDKRFFLLHGTMEKLRTEMWQYVQLSGRYSGHHGHTKPTHKNQYIYFCSHLERIRMKHIEEEYIKMSDLADSHHPPAPLDKKQETQSTQGNNVPSPPDQNMLIVSPTINKRKYSISTIGENETVIQIEQKAQGSPNIETPNLPESPKGKE
jgi:hypothetical protein